MEKLLQKVYRFLSFRDRSEKEIRDFLQRKKNENSDEIIEKLKEQGLIDDEKFAKEWAQSRRRKYGLRRIKQELVQKGISRETVESIMYQVLSLPAGEAGIKGEEEIASEALEKKAKSWQKFEAVDFKKKAIDFLMRKGFEYEVTKKVVDKFLNT